MAQVAQTFLADPYGGSRGELERRMKLAEIMQQQAFQPDQKYSYAGIEAPPSAAGALAKGLQGAVGAYMQGSAIKEGRDRSKAYGDDMAKVLSAARGRKEMAPPEGAFGGEGMTSESVETTQGGIDGMLAALAQTKNPDLAGFGGQLTMQQIALEQAKADRAAKLEDAMALKAAPGSASGATPMTVQEWEYYEKLPPEKKREFLLVKRANPYLNLKDRFAQPDPLNPGAAMGSLSVGIAPDRKIEGDRVVMLPGVSGAQVNSQPQTPALGAQQPPAAALSAPVPVAADIPLTPRQEEAKARQEGASLESTVGKADAMLDAIAGIKSELDNASLPAAGTMSAIPGMFSNTAAGKVRSHIATLGSGVAIGALTRLKESSATGASGFGALNKEELQLLIDDLGKLDAASTDPSILRKTVDRIEGRYKRVLGDIQKNVAPERLKELGLDGMVARNASPQQQAGGIKFLGFE